MVNSAKKDLKRRTEFYVNMCRLQFFKYIVHNHNIPSLIRVRYKALSVAQKTIKVKKWPANKILGVRSSALWSSAALKLSTTLGPTTGIKIKIRNRCIITGRGRGVYRFCKLSRGPLQEKALAGYLNGFSKSSW